MSKAARWRQPPAALRLVVGVFISAVLLIVTLSRVDLPAAGAAIASAAPLGLAVALGIVIVDLGLRALRWQVLLDGVRGGSGKPAYRLAFGYLSIGFVANAVLPARLGDIARAYLAGTAFAAPRLAMFGTILVERVSDGLTMLGLALVAGLVLGAAAGTAELVLLGMIVAGGGALAGIAGWLVLTRTALGMTRLGSIVGDLGGRLAAGAGALRSPTQGALVVGLTAVVTTTAVLVAWAVSGAVGLSLAPMEAVLFLSAIALSLAIPAAPGSIGTYEFVGVAVLTSLGYSPELGLATILLMRVLTTFPPVIAGLISLWALQIRPGSLIRPQISEGP
jgi:glycosyltransferase 2 family protein